jgi:hypothetical protein
MKQLLLLLALALPGLADSTSFALPAAGTSSAYGCTNQSAYTLQYCNAANTTFMNELKVVSSAVPVSGYTQFTQERPLFNFDTAALPDGAVISSATLFLHASSTSVVDSSCSLTGVWFTGNASLPSAVFNGTPNSGTAFTLALSTLAATPSQTLTLSSPGNVNKTGRTMIQVGISCNTGNGDNNATFSQYNAGAGLQPQLTVNYTVGGSRLIMVIEN